jgi:hypothetical protein
MSEMCSFETKSDAYRSASIGLILPQKLTVWWPARAAREARGFSMPRPQIVVQFGAITLSTSAIATLLGADNETVMRWFILVAALLLDPVAVLLLLASTRR